MECFLSLPHPSSAELKASLGENEIIGRTAGGEFVEGSEPPPPTPLGGADVGTGRSKEGTLTGICWQCEAVLASSLGFSSHLQPDDWRYTFF